MILVTVTRRYGLYFAAVAAVVVSLVIVALLVNSVAVANCKQIEELKAAQREEAQATITGDKLLLADHDKNGTPLPVPRAAVEADIGAKQRTVDRFPPKTC